MQKIVINMYNNESAIIVLWGLNYHKKRLMYMHAFLLGKVCVVNANDYCICGNIFFLAFMQNINCFWLAKNSLIFRRHCHLKREKCTCSYYFMSKFGKTDHKILTDSGCYKAEKCYDGNRT